MCESVCVRESECVCVLACVRACVRTNIRATHLNAGANGGLAAEAKGYEALGRYLLLPACCVCVYVCLHVCVCHTSVYVCLPVCVHKCVCMPVVCVCVCVCLHVCVLVCTCAYIYALTHT